VPESYLEQLRFPFFGIGVLVRELPGKLSGKFVPRGRVVEPLRVVMKYAFAGKH
jgi:hypothetical protein